MQPMFSSLSRQRFWVTAFLVSTLFALIAYQLLQLTIFRRAALLELADRQHVLRIEVPPYRGQILDRNGKELATNLNVPSIYAVPRLMGRSEVPALTQKLSKTLNLEASFVRGRLERDKAFVWLKRRADFEEAEKVRKMELPSLGIVDEPRRFYPQGDLLAHVLGITDVDSRGMEGVELMFNQKLRGRSGHRDTKRDALGREIRAYEAESVPAINGSRVYLTVDQYVQYLTERALDKAYLQWKAQAGWAIVMHARTGEILAMATRPTFDPNQYGSSKVDHRRNRAVTDMYEPGSVFKIVAASAVLNEGKITPADEIFCENGKYRYGSKVLHDVHPYGKLSMEDVIVKSSNIGTVKLASLLSPDVFYRYVRAFGIAELTGIDLPGEAPGFIRPPSQWSKTSPYNIPMGQEVMVTALQMTTAMGVLANGGHLIKPYIVSRVVDPAGVVLKKNKPVLKRQVLSPETVQTMQRILTRVVDEGTGTNAKIGGIPVAGKTGTAQKVLPNGRGYSHSNFISSFIGFAPADDPMLVMTVVLDDPRGRYYGGTVAAPVFKEVIEAALIYLGYVPKLEDLAGTVNDENLGKGTGTKTAEAVQESQPKLLPAQAGGRVL